LSTDATGPKPDAKELKYGNQGNTREW